MKFEFSKLIILLETFIVCYTTYKTLCFVDASINIGYTGSLPYLTTLISVVWAAYGTSVSFYYNKAKAENVVKIGCTADTVNTYDRSCCIRAAAGDNGGNGNCYRRRDSNRII